MLWLCVILSFFDLVAPGDHLSNVIVAANGDLLVVGSLRVIEEDDEEEVPSVVETETYIARLKSDGKTVKWEQSYGWIKDDHAYAIGEYPDGSLQIVGDTWSTGNGMSDAYFLLLDSTGDLIWEQDFGSFGVDTMRSLAMMSNRFVAVGHTTSSGNAPDDLPWAMSVDHEGKFLWSTIVTGEHSGRFEDVVRTRAGVVAVGVAVISSDPLDTENSVTEILIAKFSNQGEIVWQKQHIVGFNPEARAIVQTDDGGFLIAGSTQKSPGAYRDAFLLRVNKQGEFVGYKLMGGSKHDRFNDLIILPKNRYLAIGETRSFGVFSVDIWLRGGTFNGTTFVNDHFGSVAYSDSASALAAHPNGSIVFTADHHVGTLSLVKP